MAHGMHSGDRTRESKVMVINIQGVTKEKDHGVIIQDVNLTWCEL